MPKLTKDSVITVGNKELQIDDVLKTLIFLPSNQVKKYFTELGLTIPREIRMFVLREILRERVIETRKSRLTLADELNYRLSWFTEFTETQLENLIPFYDDRRLEKDYLEELWTDILSYMVDKQVSPKDVKKLIDLSIAHVRAVGLELPDMKTYNRNIKEIFFDSYGRIDGLAPSKFRPVLYKSSTLTEIRDLGSKYDVDVPRRLKKSELADIIIKELKDRGKHTDTLEQEVRGMSVIIMQRFAIDNDIKASTELKKEEIIEYILANAKETKEIYFEPTSPEAYEKEVHEVEAQVEEPVVIPVKKEVVEEKPAEPVVVAPVVKEEEPKKVSEEVKEVAVVEEEVTEIETKVVEEPKKVIKETYIPREVEFIQTVNVSELIQEIKHLKEAVEKLTQEREKDIADKPVETVEHKEEGIQQEITQAGVVIEKGKADALVINSAEFVGKPKDLKKVVKKDEAIEREIFIEQKKAEQKAKDEAEISEKPEKLPGELRFFGKVFKAFGIGLLKVLKVLLKFALILAIIGIILFAIYGTVTYFVELDFLASFNETLNGIKIGQKGLLQFFHDFLASLGI
ncbi:MAG: hypothetical protein RBT45_03740 [Acholeplasmataceae bacterium]|jgi:hypothetical protein|nr:hypothetical protein [Acholeplasmataceae bacterium]